MPRGGAELIGFLRVAATLLHEFCWTQNVLCAVLILIQESKHGALFLHSPSVPLSWDFEGKDGCGD